jgi:hypothetical protein
MTDSTNKPHTPAPAPHAEPAYQPRWSVDDIDFGRIDPARIRAQEELFYLLTSASFIESGSDLYTRNLVKHCAGYPEVAAWLRQQWEHEELQHGRALARYVSAAWPEFAWQAAFDGFFAEYARLCTVDELQPDPVLEMVARCVVETGTSTYYQMLLDLSTEPVLTELLGHVRADEVAHYKHFLAYFKQLRQGQPVSRLRVAQVLSRRLRDVRDSDSEVALRHVWEHRGGLFAHGAASFEAVSQRLYALTSARLPAEQAVRMLLKTMLLPHRLERWVEPHLARLGRRAFMRRGSTATP